MINNKARHNLINAKCRWCSNRLDGAVTFWETLGHTKVMQICQKGDTKPTGGDNPWSLLFSNSIFEQFHNLCASVSAARTAHWLSWKQSVSTHKATLQQGTPLAYPLHHFLWGFSGPFAWFTKAGKVPFTTYYCIWIARYIICLVCLYSSWHSIDPHIYVPMFSKVVYFLYFWFVLIEKVTVLWHKCLVLLLDCIHT